MIASLAAAVALNIMSPPRPMETALLKGVEACHGHAFDNLETTEFLRSAGFVPVIQTEFEYDWRWRGDGYEIQAWSNMFACGSTVIRGRLSDRDAVRIVRPWAQRHGYQPPRDASEQEALLYMMLKRDEGFDMAVGRDDAGQIRVTMAPGYFTDS
ncbi:MAG TPA: hypothetical protein VGE54_09950 [Brevundimonas sp.]